MTERSIEHAGFTIRRRYGAAPERVFAAWADPAAKGRWLAGPEEWEVGPHELDFREGGREVASGGPKEGPVHSYRAIYWEVVPNERIVYTYELLIDDVRISVSLVTVQLERDGPAAEGDAGELRHGRVAVPRRAGDGSARLGLGDGRHPPGIGGPPRHRRAGTRVGARSVIRSRKCSGSARSDPKIWRPL